MIQEGQIALFRFPQTVSETDKLRPALVLRKLPGRHNDWLICMISSRLSQELPGFDVVMYENDIEFRQSGLKMASVIRITRLAVVNKDILLGSIGRISDERLCFVKDRIASWITER